jgi:hypothetical protein
MFTTSKHHPNGGAVSHCDNTQLEQAIARFQGGDTGSLGEIIRLVEPRALTLIRFHQTNHYRPEEELLSDVNFKLMRAVGRFDARRASAFSFVSTVITSTLQTAVTATRRNWLRHSELNDEVANSLHAKTADYSAFDDLAHRIRAGVKTTLTEPLEIETQRWYIDSFTDDGFACRRHQCANAAMIVYQLSHARSRELYDLTMLEVRRVLYDDVKRREPIAPGKLYGTRCHWMAQYSPLLSSAEFTRFYYLMRDLAPYLLLLIIDPTKSNNHRQDRNPAVARRNHELILHGHPDALPLFT